MPAFTFEKIAPPVRRSAGPGANSAPPNPPKPRGTVIQVLGRFVEARVQHSEKPAPNSHGK